MEEFATAAVLGKFSCHYYRCVTCGFIQTENPFWLAESYNSPMTSYDLGCVSRPTSNSFLTSAVINRLFKPSARFLDFGGGYGIFTRWMRDKGYDFWHYDKHCANLFANGFQAEIPSENGYELVTAFEVFEHIVDPAADLETILNLSDSIFFSTELVPNPAPAIADWWYYGPEHGQHVSFYTPIALRALARRFDASYLTGGGIFHLITRRKIAERSFRLVLKPHVARVINYLGRRSSLLPSDFSRAMERAKAAANSGAATNPCARP